MVYRLEKDQWESPYSLLEVSGENVAVLTPKRAIKFRSTVVKLYLTPRNEEYTPVRATSAYTTALANDTCKSFDFDLGRNHFFDHNSISFISIYVKTEKSLSIVNERFVLSRMLESNGLLERGVFTLVPASSA